MSLGELRELWGQVIGAVPPYQSLDLLRGRLAYELQAQTHGALKPQTQRRLRALHSSLEADPTYAAGIPNALRPGNVIKRTWKGAVHKVVVREGSFEYRDKHYESLSQIARVITGANRSGPLFFGLRDADP